MSEALETSHIILIGSWIIDATLYAAVICLGIKLLYKCSIKLIKKTWSKIIERFNEN